MRSTAFSTMRSGKRALEDRLGRPLFDAADIAGVVVVDLLVALAPGEHHLVGVDDDDVVAIVHMRRERGLVLAAQARRDDGSEPPDDEAFGVDQKPLLLDVGRLGRMGLAEHVSESVFRPASAQACESGAHTAFARARQRERSRRAKEKRGFFVAVSGYHIVAPRRDRISPGRVRGELRLAIGKNRDLAHREAFAQFDEPSLADQIARRRPAKEVDIEISRHREADRADLGENGDVESEIGKAEHARAGDGSAGTQMPVMEIKPQPRRHRPDRLDLVGRADAGLRKYVAQEVPYFLQREGERGRCGHARALMRQTIRHAYRARLGDAREAG